MLKRWITMAALCGVSVGAHAELDMSGCVPVTRVPGNPPFDYNEPDKRALLVPIEHRHFTRDVETLVRGSTSFTAMGDIRYMLDISPNHPRVLQSLVRLAIREKSPRPQGAAISVDCYLKRAMEFSPRDLVPPMIYAKYLASQGQPEVALKILKDAETLAPENANLAYNLGLLSVDLKHYDEALTYAHRAYQAGFPLPGLREKLKLAGRWQEPAPLVTAPAVSPAAATAPAENKPSVETNLDAFAPVSPAVVEAAKPAKQ